MFPACFPHNIGLKFLNFSQLFYDGHQNIGTQLSTAVGADPPCAPSDRLLHLMLAGLEHEPDRKERPANPGIGSNNIGPGLGKL